MTGAESPTAKRVRLFTGLCDLAGAERRRELARIAREDAALAADLEGMLAADDASHGPLEGLMPAVAAATERRLLVEEDAPAPPARLGVWSIRERLGEGGMGEVWAAERIEGGFTQRAAVKLVRPGMASRAVVERFAVERQLLARLEHSAIARLLDGGVASDGRPWFAMERVEGIPLTRFADERGLDVEARLRLFLAVTEAVDFAHRSLVVHRDLKPSNILVTADGEPKLLDFGLAKLVEGGLDEGGGPNASRATRTDFRALTPAYAAPEQIAGEAIGTAADVYALGVILFELLTGELPLRRGSGSAESLVAGLARETIERPSARVRRLAGGVGRRLPATPRRLEGDLDTVVLKALAREPQRRYASVALLGADIVAHLERRPIAARPDALGYRAGKFVRRHGFGVAAAAIVLVSLVSALGVSLVQTRRANRAAEVARLEARRAERVKGFLVSVFEQADPTRTMGADMPARRILDEGARRLESELDGEPEVRAELFDAVARIQASLGLLEPALASAERSAAERARLFGAGSSERARSLTTAGGALLALGRFDEAATRFAESVGSLEAAGDRSSVDYARAISGEANVRMVRGDIAGAAAREREAVGIFDRALGAADAETLEHRSNLAVIESEQANYAEAIRTYREILVVLEAREPKDSANVLAVVLNLATALDISGETGEALALFLRVLEGRRRIYEPKHPVLAETLVIVSLRLSRAGRGDEALALLDEARGIYAPLDHPELASIDNYSSIVLADLGRFAEAETASRRAVARYVRDAGEADVLTQASRGNLASAIAKQGRYAEALGIFESVNAALRAGGDFDNPRLLRGRLTWGATLRDAGRIAEARAALESALAVAVERLGPEHSRVAEAEIELARVDLAENAAGAAESAARRLARAEAIAAKGPLNPSLSRRLAAAKAELERRRPEQGAGELQTRSARTSKPATNR